MNEKEFTFKDGANDTVEVRTLFRNTNLEINFIDEDGEIQDSNMIFDKSHIEDFERILKMLKELN